ncbi:hypothetical protein NT6N_16000 [Oceaniferula spumae]|uniref:Verru_Chthon cassette protein A n=1 Tax=Oceaniferula spumae TaxID=2979115 RepID=A0AAT9FKR2_9BACT
MNNFSKPSHQPGFALVATISIMVLLVMIALALLSLATLESRSGDDDKAIAQANARMALMLAIGDLQKNVGPDQRVTATAAILEEPEGLNTIQNRHWAGVWRTDRLKAETETITGQSPLIYRKEVESGALESDSGTIVDRRMEDYDRKAEVLTWLVSRPGLSQLPDPLTFASSDAVEMVGNGSASSSDHVRVPRVSMTNGSFAWWVSDDNAKARFNLSGTGNDEAPAWLHPVKNGIDVMTNLANYNAFSRIDRARSVTNGTGDLSLRVNGTSSEDFKKRFHDVSFQSAGVIADSLNGGMRRDLTAFIANGTLPAAGPLKPEITADTPIIDATTLREISPKFGMLKTWAELAGQITSQDSIDVIPPEAAANAIQGFMTSPSQSSGGPAIQSQKTAPVHPVIVDAGITYGMSLVDMGPASDSDPSIRRCRFRYHYFPRVVLWNPYQVELKAADYAVQISMPHAFSTQVNVAATGSTPARTINQHYCTPNAVTQNPNNNLPHRPVFSIKGAKFLPGQALLFTADSSAVNGPGDTIAWGPNSVSRKDDSVTSVTSSISSYPLSCDNPLPLTTSFMMEFHYVYHFDPKEVTYAILPIKDAGNGGGYKQFWYKLWQVKGNDGPGSIAAIQSNNTTDYPPLQFIAQTEDGTWGSDAPWIAGIPSASTEKLSMTEDGTRPYYRGKWGHRLPWLIETNENRTIKAGDYNIPFLDYNLLGNHNIRSNWFFRSPVEIGFRASAAAGRYFHGYLMDDFYSWDWNDPTLGPVSVAGVNQVSPFGAPALFGNIRFPLISVPTRKTPPLTVGAFQHAPLSLFAWQPTFAVGNSLADIRCRRDRTVNYVPPGQDNVSAPSTASWSMGVHRRMWSKYRQTQLDSEMDRQAFIYDLSYEANHALWDRYFLSSLPRSYTAADTPPNQRIFSLLGRTDPATDALDGNKAASQLMIDGAFNVNSTSVEAWAALFASFRDASGLDIDGSISGNDIYSHLLQPTGKKYSNGGAYDEASWNGYHQLNDTQIRELAKEVVAEVKRRGPFLSLSDFVNRRLVNPPSSSGSETDVTRTGLKGTLQAALDRTEINQAALETQPIAKDEYVMRAGGEGQVVYGNTYPDPTFPLVGGNGSHGAKPDHNHFADSKMVGTPAQLTQADMLQKLGSVLSARGDTFTIRAYGESKDANGNVKARAWAEAVVQRTPKPILADDTGIDCAPDGAGVFGRSFVIVSFRWLNPEEV